LENAPVMGNDIKRRLPGGYGTWSGDTAYLDNASDQAGRNSQQESAGGWWITSVGDAFLTHQELAGATFTANQMRLIPIPPRIQSVRVQYVRIRVITANAGATVQTALYFYDDKERVFRKFPGTTALFDASTTGQKTYTLPEPVEIKGSTQVFVSQWSNDSAVVLTGFAQLGSKVLSSRNITTTTPMGGSYLLSESTLGTGTSSIGLVAYLSSPANLVL
jgi:hypothetical protein